MSILVYLIPDAQQWATTWPAVLHSSPYPNVLDLWQPIAILFARPSISPSPTTADVLGSRPIGFVTVLSDSRVQEKVLLLQYMVGDVRAVSRLPKCSALPRAAIRIPHTMCWCHARVPFHVHVGQQMHPLC